MDLRFWLSLLLGATMLLTVLCAAYLLWTYAQPADEP
jgi:hypothetical protein